MFVHSLCLQKNQTQSAQEQTSFHNTEGSVIATERMRDSLFTEAVYERLIW